MPVSITAKGDNRYLAVVMEVLSNTGQINYHVNPVPFQLGFRTYAGQHQ